MCQASSPTFKLHTRIHSVEKKKKKKTLKKWTSDHSVDCHNKIKEINDHIYKIQSLDKYANNLALDSAL